MSSDIPIPEEKKPLTSEEVKEQLRAFASGKKGSLSDDGFQEAFEEYDEIIKEARGLCRRKANDYGTESLDAFGPRGVIVRIWDKVCRLRNLLWRDTTSQVKSESIDDTLIDLINYAVITIAMRRDKWKRKNV
jgi:hypothetical protein